MIPKNENFILENLLCAKGALRFARHRPGYN